MSVESEELPQNSEANLIFRKAIFVVYREANRIVVGQFFLVVLAPIAMAVIGLFCPELKSHFVLAGLLIALFDVVIVDRALSVRISEAAKIAEEFDCRVLNIPWASVFVGSRYSFERLRRHAKKFSDRKLSKVVNWYPKEAFSLSPERAALLCQRTNLWYDSELRRSYASMVGWAGGGLLFACLIASWAQNQTLQGGILYAVAPLFPFLSWTVRTYWRQKDVSDAQLRNLSSADLLLRRIAKGALLDGDAWSEIRELQNAIYARRSASPLMLPLLYRFLRPEMEDQMANGASQLIEELKLRN